MILRLWTPRTTLWIGALLLGLAVGLTAIDALTELDEFSPFDLAVDLFERLLLMGAMLAVAVTVLRIDRIEREAGEVRTALAHAEARGRAWRDRSRRLLEGLSQAVASQLDAWGLTPAEAEIAGLMLKGLPLRDIAALRGRSEATIRQQAQGIYRKSGLANRAELAAYFLEDLFTVAEEGAATAEPRTLS